MCPITNPTRMIPVVAMITLRPMVDCTGRASAGAAAGAAELASVVDMRSGSYLVEAGPRGGGRSGASRGTASGSQIGLASDPGWEAIGEIPIGDRTRIDRWRG